jgi:hypothetical protein
MVAMAQLYRQCPTQVSISRSDGSTANPRTNLNITANLTVIAQFAATTYTFVATCGANRSISPSDNVVVGYGQGQTCIFFPDTGYSIHVVILNDEEMGNSASNTFSLITSNQTPHVIFTLITNLQPEKA